MYCGYQAYSFVDWLVMLTEPFLVLKKAIVKKLSGVEDDEALQPCVEMTKQLRELQVTHLTLPG